MKISKELQEVLKTALFLQVWHNEMCKSIICMISKEAILDDLAIEMLGRVNSNKAFCSKNGGSRMSATAFEEGASELNIFFPGDYMKIDNGYQAVLGVADRISLWITEVITMEALRESLAKIGGRR